MTTINDIADLVRILQDDPAWAEAVRSVLLSQELLRMPEEFADFAKAVRENSETVNQRLERLEEGQARLESDVADLKTGQARLESDVADLKTGQARLESDVADLKTGYARLEEGQARLESDVADLKVGQSQLQSGVNRMQGEIGNLMGSDFQRRAGLIAARFAKRDFHLKNPTVVHQAGQPFINTLGPVLNEAIDNDSIAFSNEDALEVELTDAVVFGQSQDGNDMYLLMEASVTVMEDDVVRVRERASLLAEATGTATEAVVVGATITEEADRMAQEQQVTFIPFDPRRPRAASR